ncbi:MAG: YeeE/YedE thiosulfate transporter family protein [Rhodocyclaceae bacterium]|nr:YeeE/YedE thiosulfate transporter family protein [Rhodocyclaceae bacterium]
MGLVASASASRGAAARGVKIPGNMVLMVFRNDYAVRMLAASVAAGIEAPLRLYLTENADGSTTISYVRPARCSRPTAARRSMQWRENSIRCSTRSCMTLPADEPARSRTQWTVIAVAALLAVLPARFAAESGWRFFALFVVGILLGATLHRFAFGFAYAYRRLIVQGDTRGLRAQLPMLALATLLFAPALATGQVFGMPVGGALAPLAMQVAAGAFLFGIGMQLGGGCGSGTLPGTAGGGNPRMLVVLASFCAGSFWASLHMGWWQATPAWGAFSIGEALGWGTAAVLQGLTLAALPVRAAWRWDSGRGATHIDLLLIGDSAARRAQLCHPHPRRPSRDHHLGIHAVGAKAPTLIGWAPAGDGFWSAPFQSAGAVGRHPAGCDSR